MVHIEKGIDGIF